MYRLLTVMGLAVVATLAVPQESAAQECDLCQFNGEKHWFTGELCEGTGGCKACGIIQPKGHIGCHAAKIQGPCWTHALLCDSVFALDLPEDEEVLTVVASRDVGGAAELIWSGGVHLNLERRAIQVLGCKGSVLSHIPIGDDFYADLTTALQQAEAAAEDPPE